MLAEDVNLEDMEEIGRYVRETILRLSVAQWLEDRNTYMIVRMMYGEDIIKGYRREQHRQGLTEPGKRLAPFWVKYLP